MTTIHTHILAEDNAETKPQARIRTVRNWRVLILPVLITGLVVLPIAFLSARILTPSFEVWAHLWETILPQMLANTLILMAGVSLGTLIIGVGLAWLVTAYDFPGRKAFDVLLLLPLAMPSFVLGFVYMATFDYAGPVQTALHTWFGPQFPFPEIRSGGGAILVLSLVLYPYVYLLSRAAFREQSASTFEAAQVMGLSRTRTFFRLVLPMARPSIIAGVSLAMMEAITDFATVRFFNFPTLSEGIVRVWQVRMDRQAASELATLLLVFALALVAIERTLRGRAKYYQTGMRSRQPARKVLKGFKRLFAIFACVSVLGAAFFLPTLQLIAWAINEIQVPTAGEWRPIFGQYVSNSFSLAAVAALVTIFLALIVANGTRMARRGALRKAARIVARLSTLGYAMPGAVIAVGVLLVVSPVEHALSDLTGIGLVLTGTVAALIYAYVVRFMSVAYSSVDSSLEKVTPNMEHAARTLGARPLRVLWRIHLPLVSTGVAAGAILVFMDVMKELPVTLLLRPFGMDTLSIWAYMLASESFWQAAAIPSLTILIVGLIPVVLLMRIGHLES